MLETTEYVCETWGVGEATLQRYAPLSREPCDPLNPHRLHGRVWIHPTLAREYEWAVITARATRIWSVSGSLWNPRDFRLIYSR